VVDTGGRQPLLAGACGPSAKRDNALAALAAALMERDAYLHNGISPWASGMNFCGNEMPSWLNATSSSVSSSD